MTKPRSGTSYRLSEGTQKLLDHLSVRLGITKTSVVEMAVRKLAFAELGEAECEPCLVPAVSLHENPSGLRQA
jgi:hypothetical protein